MQDFPSGDPVKDTEAYVALLQQQVRKSPEQYFWVHKKFKNLPSPYPDYYSDLDSLK